jgi:hypothetical protein
VSADYFVRSYDPVADTEEWHGPFFLPRSADSVVEELKGKCQTRVYHRSELQFGERDQ